MILVTCHRRENRGEVLVGVASALKRLARDLPVEILFALHMNLHVRRPIEELLRGEPHIRLLPPLSYEVMVALMRQSWLIITDSGGLQEEGPALGRPVLVLREITERDEVIASGNADLVGTDPDRIVAAVSALLIDEGRYARMAVPAFPYGDGHAARRITDVLGDFLSKRRHATAA